MNNFQTITDFLNVSSQVEVPASYEFYQLNTNFPDTENVFVIKNTYNGKSIYVRNLQNRVEIDTNYKDYNADEKTKISIIDFFKKLKGIGVSYIEKL